MTHRASSLEARALFADAATLRLSQFGETELRLLRMFSVVVQAQGFSAATAELQVDLSTISRQFKELEARVGARLARRGRGGFTLTPEGEQLLRMTRQLFGAIHSFNAELGSLAGGAAPLLRLGAVDALLSAPEMTGPVGLPAALAACERALPGLQVQLQLLRPTEIERRILADELDAGLMAARAPAAGLEQHGLYSETSGLYVGPGHPWHGRRSRQPLSEAELAQARVVADPYWNELPPAARAGLHPGLTRADSIEGVALLVASGLCAGFLPEHFVARLPALASLRPVEPARFRHAQDIVLSCRSGQLPPPLRALLRALRGNGAAAVPR
jgi:DNA-binding transcriptional LysR family regulator